MTVSRLSISGTSGIALPQNYLLDRYQDRIVNYVALTSGPTTQTISSTTPVTITGLSVNYTPAGTNTTIFIFANINHSRSHVLSFAIYKDGLPTVSTTGFVNNNQPDMQVTYYTGEDAGTIVNSHLMHYEVSGSTAPRIYDVRGTASWNNNTRALYIDNRNSGDMAAFSHMVLMEVD